MHSLAATQDKFGCGSSCLDTLNVRCYLSLVNISMQKSKIIMHSFEILMEVLYGSSRKLLWAHFDPFLCSFFICYLTTSRPTLGHYLGDSLTHPNLISAFNLILTQRSSKVIVPILQQSLNQLDKQQFSWKIRISKNFRFLDFYRCARF